MQVAIVHEHGRGSKDTVGRFLKEQSLGLMTSLGDIVNQSASVTQPVQEQKRCLRAIETLVTFCKDDSPRPQVPTALELASP